ncbi:MAG TPA: peptide deformylase [Bacteroidota bacterium]|nr:peptide deformylase [Bacteroidota bacterium]
MAVLPIYTYGAPVLREKARPVKEVTDDVIRLIMDMFETMHKAGGIGLAATQVGRLERIIVIDVSDIEELKEVKPLTIINPEVMSPEGTLKMEEGCLSIPDIRDEVVRADAFKLRYRDTSFRSVEMEVRGMLGRVILHEIDHLNGVLFLDHLTAAQLRNHSDELKKIERGDMEVSYPVVTAVDIAA